ncbi:MAG: helix-turn-helix domain-containing protein, partial [Myxococcota bacterium]
MVDERIIADIADEYLAGASQRELAAKYRISQSSISKELKARGVVREVRSTTDHGARAAPPPRTAVQRGDRPVASTDSSEFDPIADLERRVAQMDQIALKAIHDESWGPAQAAGKIKGNGAPEMVRGGPRRDIGALSPPWTSPRSRT